MFCKWNCLLCPLFCHGSGLQLCSTFAARVCPFLVSRGERAVTLAYEKHSEDLGLVLCPKMLYKLVDCGAQETLRQRCHGQETEGSESRTDVASCPLSNSYVGGVCSLEGVWQGLEMI